jgi:hypothetical protein
MLDGFLLLMKGLSLTNQLLSPSFFFGLGVTNNAVKPDCIPPTGAMVLRMRVVSPASSLLSKSMKHCSQGGSNLVKNAKTSNLTLISLTRIQRKFLLGFLYYREMTC